MTNKEKKYLDYVDERVFHCLKQGIDKKQIFAWIDDVIYDLPEDTSTEFIDILFKIQYNLIVGNKIIN